MIYFYKQTLCQPELVINLSFAEQTPCHYVVVLLQVLQIECRQQDALADRAHTPRGILVLGLDGALSGNALVVQDLCSCSVVRLCLIYRQPHHRQDADDAEGDRYEQVDVRGSHDVAPT
jgi:hypothetical protein